MIKPISDQVVVEAVKEAVKKGAILLPDTVEKEKSEKGKVVATGPGKISADGKRIPMEVKKGDVVVFKKYSFHMLKVDDKEYLVGSQDGIYAVIS